MTDFEFNDRINNIDKECMLRRYKIYQEAATEVDVFFIEKQKEQRINIIKSQFEDKMPVEKPKIIDNGRYVIPCSIKGVSPYDIMKEE